MHRTLVNYSGINPTSKNISYLILSLLRCLVWYNYSSSLWFTPENKSYSRDYIIQFCSLCIRQWLFAIILFLCQHYTVYCVASGHFPHSDFVGICLNLHSSSAFLGYTNISFKWHKRKCAISRIFVCAIWSKYSITECKVKYIFPKKIYSLWNHSSVFHSGKLQKDEFRGGIYTFSLTTIG